ncbi:MAG: hypothetical protein ABW186_01460 [Rhodanobacteraceae bacterium]
MRISICAGVVIALLAGHAFAGSFTDIGVPGAQLTSLSRNGRLAAGINGGTAWRWNKDRGSVDMTGFISSNGMNSWGQPVAGAYTATGDVADASAAIYYSNSDLVGGPVVIGAFPGSGGGFDQGSGEAYGVSDNGIAVGLAYDETNNPIAFRWTEADGMTRLAVNRPDTFSRANGISRNGSVIYGWNDQDTGFRSGVIWVDGKPIDLVDADGNPVGEALAASGDGRVVVGAGYNTVNGSEAWRWTAATGVQPIGLLAGTPAKPGKHMQAPAKTVRSERVDTRLARGTDGFGFAQAYAFAVSDNGNLVAGSSGSFPFREAIVWTPSGGMQPLADYAAAHGVAIPAGWDLNTADAVSADGQTIAGWGFGPSSVGSFVIDLHSSRLLDALVTARGTVDFNNLQSGPFVGVPSGTPVTMTFRLSPDGFEVEPGEDTVYPIEVPTFRLVAGTASDTIVGGDSASVNIANDYPLSDGVHLFGTPTSGGQSVAFELFNPGGNLFDSDDLARINRTFGPEFFEKIAWSVSQGSRSMDIMLDSVTVADFKPRVSPH